MKKTTHKTTKDPGKISRLPNKKQVKFGYKDVIGLVIILLLGILIYSNSFDSAFQFDDSFNIVDNPNIRDLSDVGAIWEYSQRRFVSMYTFAVNYHFDGLEVRGYHLVNLIIHLITGVLVWALTWLIISSPVLKDHAVARHKHAIAFLTALLFVSHPLATQSVTYIVQRMASMAAMFYLLSLVLYIKARLAEKRNTFTWVLFAGSFLAAILAFFSKENAYTLPFAVLLVEIFFLQPRISSIDLSKYPVIGITVASCTAIFLLLIFLSATFFEDISPALGNTYTITPTHYLWTQFSVIVKYIQLLFLPIHQNLDYDFPLSTSFFEAKTMLSFVFLVSLVGLAVFLFNKNRIITFGIIWFFLTLSIESSFFPITDLIFEHRTYLPSVGFFLACVAAMYGVLGDKHRYLVFTLFTVIALANSYLTYERNKVWKDELTLWEDVAAKSPQKARPVATIGDCYRNLEQWDKAISNYSAAIVINPAYATAFHNRAAVYSATGQPDKAIEDYSRAIQIDPAYQKAVFNRGNAYSKLGQWENAVADYTRAIEIDPTLTAAYYGRSVAYGRLKRWDEAIADCNRAIEIDTTYVQAFANRGFIYNNLGQWEKAIGDYTSAIALNPKDATTYFNRGVAYGNLGQWQKAIDDYSRAIEFNPEMKNAYTNRDLALHQLQ